MTTSASLTDRYVAAVLRSLPEDKRADIEKELRASIADAVDARLENGEAAADAERAVLQELGDPARLAAGYAGRPLWLVGPAYYVEYVRFLRLLLVIVLPIVAAVLVVTQVLAGANVGQVVGGGFATLLTVAVHMVFWITLLFVVLERTGTKAPVIAFDLDDLPLPATETTPKLSDLVATLVFLLFTVGALAWQQMSSVFLDGEGNPIPLLQPDLWALWIPVFIALCALTLVHAVVLYSVGRWTVPLLVTVVLLNLASAAVVVWLLVTGRLLNPAFFAEFGWDDVFAIDGVGTIVTVLGVIVIAIGGILDAAVKTRRTLAESTARRGAV
jgi:hypothetical protein